ncbi:hypothetical protein EDL80_03105 [Ehrlichia ruminantium]|uniref:Uncharacterized protein n=1 Tax=Ehrlichia ruminantium TaxID=779 RepID=A0AAE6Q960_EHRRU|nr:hypothetical protein [Ehrlichia ruminantium]QGR03542.1 hypothetical protein EDL80_03105 [Ehrlichia ruminantium]
MAMKKIKKHVHQQGIIKDTTSISTATTLMTKSGLDNEHQFGVIKLSDALQKLLKSDEDFKNRHKSSNVCIKFTSYKPSLEDKHLDLSPLMEQLLGLESQLDTLDKKTKTRPRTAASTSQYLFSHKGYDPLQEEEPHGASGGTDPTKPIKPSIKSQSLLRSLSLRHKDRRILQEEEEEDEELRGASGGADPTKPIKGKFVIPQVSITKLTSPKKKSYGTGQPQESQLHGISNLGYDEGASGGTDPTKPIKPSIKSQSLLRSLSLRHKDRRILQEEEEEDEELRGASGGADPTKPIKGKFVIPQVSITKLTSPKKKSYGTGQPQESQLHGISNLGYGNTIPSTNIVITGYKTLVHDSLLEETSMHGSPQSSRRC